MMLEPRDPRPIPDLEQLDTITQEQIEDRLTTLWNHRQPLYNFYAEALMLDYAPDFWKRSRWGWTLFGQPDPSTPILFDSQNIHSYMMFGWETGIRNVFDNLRRLGMSKAQLMEVVMFSQIYSGMRGLGHVYRAVGEELSTWGDPPSLPGDRPPPIALPEGWAADPDAFKAGLDMSTRKLTPQDRTNLTEWYERTIGYVPKSVQFGMKAHPEFIKANRAKWEVAIRTMPKQLAPYIMIRHNMITGSEDGLRESALLAKAWGVTPKLIKQGIFASANFFTGFEGLYTAHAAVEDLLEE